MAGAIAIKAFAQSNSGSYGSALKTARAVWEQDGTELGNLVTLFHCSFRYESYSNTNMDGDKSNQDNASFSNTLLELGNSLSVYLSLSKRENADSLQYLNNNAKINSYSIKNLNPKNMLLKKPSQ